MFFDGRSYLKRVKFGEETESEVKLIQENLIFENKWIKFYNDSVKFPNGTTSNFLRLETPGRDGTVVVAVRPATSEIAVVKQYRYAPGLWMVEFPRGFANSGDVSGIMTGWRELLEETGQIAAFDGIFLGRLVTDSGKLGDAPFLALLEVRTEVTGEPIAPQPDETEVLAPEKYGYWVKYCDLKDWVERGYIIDSFTCAAMARIAPHFDSEGRYQPNWALIEEPNLADAERLFGKRGEK